MKKQKENTTLCYDLTAKKNRMQRMVFPMIKSIHHFEDFGVKKLAGILEIFLKEPEKQAEFIYGITDSVVQLELDIIAETFENMDDELRNSVFRKKNWVISRRDSTSLITSLGVVNYHKTLFKNKNNGASEYLLDRIMGFKSHMRMTEDAEAQMLEEAVDSSYHKGGIKASLLENVSKQTVKNKIHELKFYPQIAQMKKKKQVPYLYIDADEDHVSLQYLEKKGDITNLRGNTSMPKIAYVYEGVETDAPKSKRNKLINPKYFGGLYEGSKGVEQFWKEINDYISATYDLNTLKHIYINGDGAGWIKSGCKWVSNSTFVLDKFHMKKYITTATPHLLDSAEDARSEIYQAIYKRKKWMMSETFERILKVTESEAQRKKVEASEAYILGNWEGIMQGQRNKEVQTGCSAEGHVSHIYADRMSSRPMGWSRHGVDQMAKLRIYKANQGKMLDLVRMQKQEVALAVGYDEEQIFLSSEMFRAERKRLTEEQKYVERITYTIPFSEVKKMAYFKSHIWGL